MPGTTGTTSTTGATTDTEDITKRVASATGNLAVTGATVGRMRAAAVATRLTAVTITVLMITATAMAMAMAMVARVTAVRRSAGTTRTDPAGTAVRPPGRFRAAP
jgi:hypothetical protein